VSNQALSLVLGITLLGGIAIGYAVRKFISYRRRTAARRKAAKRYREEARRLGFYEVKKPKPQPGAIRQKANASRIGAWFTSAVRGRIAA